MPHKSRPHTDEFDFPFEEYLEDSEFPEDYSHTDFRKGDLPETLGGTFQERLKILREAIEEIDTEIGIRKQLHKTFQEGLKDSRDWLATSLRKFDNWQFGYQPSVDLRRTTLERELLGVYREARAEHQRAFSDIVGLKRERRNLLMEYKSLKATGKALAP